MTLAVLTLLLKVLAIGFAAYYLARFVETFVVIVSRYVDHRRKCLRDVMQWRSETTRRVMERMREK